MSSESMVDIEQEIEQRVSKPNQGMTSPETLDFFAKGTNLDDPLYDLVTQNHVFHKFARKSLQPNLQKLSRKSLRNKIIDIYIDGKQDLIHSFDDLDCGLVVSCDLWTSFNGDDHYLCVICHWVRDDTAFKNNVIGFELLYPFDYANVASKIVHVLDKYHLKDKINGISFEDGICKEKCREHLSKEFNPVVPEMFYLDRTFVDVVDLCAQQIVDELSLLIDPFRELYKWFRCSNKKEELRALREDGIPPLFRSGFSKEWSDTIDRLSSIYEHKEILAKLYNECENHFPLVDSQWDAMKAMVNLLYKFSNFMMKYHWASDAGCHLAIQDCVIVAHTLRSYESDPRFGSVVRNVRNKWLELFPEIPTIYCVATILDPRVQVKGLRQLLAYYYETLGVTYDVDGKVAHSVNVLKQLIAHREQPHKAETNLGEGENKSSSSLEFNVIRDVLKRKREDDQEKRDELDDYLSYEFDVSDDNENLIFEWWTGKREILPVLSNVATDVLCTPMFTSIPHEKYCPRKRVLDKRRSMLPPGLLRVCICKTDWDLARKSSDETNGYGGCDQGEYYTDYEEDD